MASGKSALLDEVSNRIVELLFVIHRYLSSLSNMCQGSKPSPRSMLEQRGASIGRMGSAGPRPK